MSTTQEATNEILYCRTELG